MLYLFFKSFHIFFVISWMAALLYLFRLLVYQSEESEVLFIRRLQDMRLKLYRRIALPGMGLAIIFGIGLIFLNPHYLEQKWLWFKLLLVLFLIGLTHWVTPLERRVERKEISSSFLRLLNELPTLLLLAIIFLVVFKFS